MSARQTSTTARLIRLGVREVGAAQAALASTAWGILTDSDELLEAVGAAADPDLAIAAMTRLLEAAELADQRSAQACREAMLADPVLRTRLSAVLGASVALGEHLRRHPGDWVVCREGEPVNGRRALLESVGADPSSREPIARHSRGHALESLRSTYRRLLLDFAARDLTGEMSFDEVARGLAQLADGALTAALAIARAELPHDAEPCRLAVIALGKCGGLELNYISDVDVIFVAEAHEGGDEPAALRTAGILASGLMRACSEATAEGSLWEVDAGLRPEGRQGVLVRTLRSHVDYYQRWAKTWEFQALLKARWSAGDEALGHAYVDAVSPMVWSAADREGFVDDVQAMRRRVEQHIPARDAPHQLKLGAGGLRDVEFSVQLLQLVHGRSDVSLRSATTLVALEALSIGGYVGRDDAATLASAYRFLRSLEHRMQLHQLVRTHLIPQDPADLRRLGRSMGFRSDPAEELAGALRSERREVRRLHEKLFYRPLLNAVARLDAGEARLTPEAARQRMEALGYADPAGALRNIEALTTGVSRRAAIQRTLLPVMLGWFADAPDPDAGLLAFRQVSDALGATPWYLRLLRDESAAAERMALVLASSRFAADLLLRAPESVVMLADDAELQPRTSEQLNVEVEAILSRNDDPETAIAAVRAVRRRELLRLAVGDLLGLLDVDAIGMALSELTRACLSAALAIAMRALGPEPPTRIAIIAMGRLGGAELGFGSDADVVFVHEPLPGVEEKVAADAAFRVANEVRRLLMVPTVDPPLPVDADLRPEGRQGPLVRTLASYAAYYSRWSASWEAQALVRAAPGAGDADVTAAFLAIADDLRYPAAGLDEGALRDMRRIKARMESERLPRGADPALHTKLGRGGLSDVEWAVQVLQMEHGHRVPHVRTTRTMDALRAAATAGLLSVDDAGALESAWLLATRVRSAIVLVRGTPSDVIPSAGVDLARVARLLGYPAGDSGRLLEDYRRTTRRARVVVERVFYGS